MTLNDEPEQYFTEAAHTVDLYFARIEIVTDTVELIPAVFTPNAHLSDEINRNIIQSEIEGGVFLNNLPQGAVLEIETQNRVYTLVSREDGDALLSGHPTFCPDTVHGR